MAWLLLLTRKWSSGAPSAGFRGELLLPKAGTRDGSSDGPPLLLRRNTGQALRADPQRTGGEKS